MRASPQVPEEDCGAVLRQKTGPALGGRLSAWISRRLGFDLALQYVLSGAVAYPIASGEGSLDLDLPAHLATGSARILFNLSPRRSPNGFYVAGGPGFVAHRGPTYVDLTAQRLGSAVAPTNVGWGANLGVGFRAVEHPDKFEVRLELEDFLYEFSGEVNPQGTTYPDYLQNDLVFSFGVVLGLLGPGGWIR